MHDLKNPQKSMNNPIIYQLLHIFYSNWYCLQRLQFHNHLFIWRRATILVKKPFVMMRLRISMHDIVCLINCQVFILICGILMYIDLFYMYVYFICTGYQGSYLHIYMYLCFRHTGESFKFVGTISCGLWVKRKCAVSIKVNWCF